MRVGGKGKEMINIEGRKRISKETTMMIIVMKIIRIRKSYLQQGKYSTSRIIS